MTLAAMPASSPSDAIARVSPITPILAMPYTAPPGTPPNAAPDETFTKRPPPRSAITAHAGRPTLSAPRSCVSMTASSCASVSSGNGAMRTCPALFTTTSTAPNASSAASTMARPPSGVAMVSRFATASPPAATISATTESAGGSVGASATPSVSLMPTPRSFTSTRAPRAANRSAYSRPRLRPAPVTTTTFPSNRSSLICVHGRAPFLPGGDLLVEVAGGHAHVELRVAFVVHVRMQAPGVEARPQQLLGELHADVAEPDDPRRELVAPFQQLVAGHHLRHQADALGLLGVDVTTGEEDVERTREADLPRQQIADAELVGREAVVDPRGAEVGGIGADADVGRARQAEATTDRRTVHGCDHRLVHVADRQDHLVEHAQRPPGDARALQPRDVRHHAASHEVGAGAEPVAGTGEHDDAAVVVGADVAEGVAQRDHHVERHRVHAFRAIERDQRDVRSWLGDFDEGHAGHSTKVDRRAIGVPQVPDRRHHLDKECAK